MQYVITKMSQTTMADAHSRMVPAIAVNYTVGNHGPFTETFPLSGFTPQAVKERLTTMAQHIAALSA